MTNFILIKASRIRSLLSNSLFYNKQERSIQNIGNIAVLSKIFILYNFKFEL